MTTTPESSNGPSMPKLQKMVRKYTLTSSGTRKQVARRIYDLRSIYLTMAERRELETFLGREYLHKKRDTRKRKRLP